MTRCICVVNTASPEPPDLNCPEHGDGSSPYLNPVYAVRPRQVRGSTSGRGLFYVVGDDRNPLYVRPHTHLIEVEGRYPGGQFSVPTEDVANWPVISEPKDLHSGLDNA